jgi:hypothetical protein
MLPSPDVKPVDEELEARHPPAPLDYLYWAMVNDGVLEMPKELIAPSGE